MYLHIYLKLLPPLLQAILSRFCGCTTTQMGPLLSTQSHRTVSDHWLKPHVNLALMEHFFKCLSVAPFFHPLSPPSVKKMHFWVFLLFCTVPFWDVEWAKANLYGLTHINVIFHLIQPTNLTQFVNLTRSKAGWCWPEGNHCSRLGRYSCEHRKWHQLHLPGRHWGQ